MIDKWSTQAVKESEDAEHIACLVTLYIKTWVKDLINLSSLMST